MIDCMKKYKMVLSSTDGEIVYKSDNVQVNHAEVYDVEQNRQFMAEIEMTARGMQVEEAGTPLEMPTAEVAAQATKIIQEEKRKAAIEKEWGKLIGIVCAAVKDGQENVKVEHLFQENEIRLIDMGYDVMKEGYHWRIRWIDPILLF